MAVNINAELATIETEIYGEEIRDAIHDALEKLKNGVYSKSEANSEIDSKIATAIETFYDGKDAVKVKGVLPNNANLNVYATTNNGEYSGVYFIKYDYTYSNLPSGLTELNANGVLINLNGRDKDISVASIMGGFPFIQIVFPIEDSFSGNFWVRTNTVSGWKLAGGGSSGSVSPQDITNAVDAYLTEHGIDDEIEGKVADYIAEHGDRTYSTNSDLNSSVTKYKQLNSSLTSAETTYIDNALSTYTGYTEANEIAKSAVADGIIGLAAFLYAKAASNKASHATMQELTTAMTNVKGLLYTEGDPSVLAAIDRYTEHLAEANRCAISDGILGFAAFKRTEWFPTPQMYGAKGNNDADDTDAIQAAINANKGKTLYFPEGTYLITKTLTVGYAATGQNAYTNLIFDPRACIKASSKSGNTWDQRNPNGTGMIAIGKAQWHDWDTSVDGSNLASKRSKKFFIGGIFDSNSQYVTSIIRVSQDCYSFDMSNSVILATDSTTGLAIGSSGWSRKNFGTDADPDWRYSEWKAAIYREGVKFVLSSMDAYIHHIYINKYAYNDRNRQNYPSQEDFNNNTNNKHNRASGIVIYSNDNNFDNIRICYFKRQVKITQGTGNYFSDVHTLGYKKQYYTNRNGDQITPDVKYTSGVNNGKKMYPTHTEWETAISNGDVDVKTDYSNYYPTDTSGFHLESRTEITMDQCYVDSDECFCYVTSEAAGSKINASQCILYEYQGVERSLRGFYLGSEYYNPDTITVKLDGHTDANPKTTNITNPYKGKLTQLFVDGFQFSPSGWEQSNFEKHVGILISGSASGVIDTNDGLRNSTDKVVGGYFFDQTHTSNMSLERIKIVGYNWFKRGDLLVGASSGKKGSVLLRPTPLARYGSTANSKWYALCVIPVAAGLGGIIQYRVTMDLGGKYFTIPLTLYKKSGVNLTVNASDTKVITNDDRKYEIGFTYVSGTTPLYGYVVWLRIVDNVVDSTFFSRTVREVLFESSHCITPSPYNGGFEALKSSDTLTPVNLNEGSGSNAKNVIRIKCGDKATELAKI